jgi:hypothetical protein
MKVFWSLLAVIALAALAAIFWPSAPSKSSEFAALAVPDTKEAKPAPAPAANAPAVVPSSGTTSNPQKSAAAPTPAANGASAPAKTPPASAAISPDSLKNGLGRTFGTATVVPGNIIKQADGSILADNKYLIAGSGTAEDPYRITWECLTSASQSYVPRLQQYGIPQRVAMLDGTWVRIEGYLAFPLMLQESSEILAMLNQWDGCCIGVPPTPYDAIEVKLATPVKPGRRHTFNFGTVTGKFKVDPYLVENWLVGLYQLESASLQSDM